MVKKLIFAGIVLAALVAAILYVIPWGNYESNLKKSNLEEQIEEVDSTGNVIPSLDLIEGLFKPANDTSRIAEILFEIDGLKNTKGAYEEFEISFNVLDSFENSSLDVIIQAESVNTNNSMRDESLVSDEFFDVKKYPTIEFHSNSVSLSDTGYIANGDLTLMATTKSLKVPFSHLGAGTYDSGQQFQAFEGKFTFDRTQYGMKEESGVGNLVTISFYCELIKQ